MGSFSIRHETDVVIPYILERLKVEGGRLDWTSGYFSIRREDKRAVLDLLGDGNQIIKERKVRIVAASPDVSDASFLN
jgi:hypothetical protein